jgi:hypothetical protein
MAEHGHVHEHGDADTGSVGIHGMLLFGDDTIYLSHLPMFGPPHNFQVLLAVSLDDAAGEALTSDRADDPADMYTFVPTEFDIEELDPDGDGPRRTTMDGAIFHGHFERGGAAISDAVVTVDEVVCFTRLDVDESPQPDRKLGYLAFGEPGHLYLAHEITARPNFDHVLAVELVPDSVADQAGRSLGEDVGTIGWGMAQRVRFERPDEPDSRLGADETANGLFFQTISEAGAHGFSADLTVRQEIYLEIDELA